MIGGIKWLMENLDPLESEKNYVEMEQRINIVRRLYWLYLKMYIPTHDPNADRVTQLELVKVNPY